MVTETWPRLFNQLLYFHYDKVKVAIRLASIYEDAAFDAVFVFI